VSYGNLLDAYEFQRTYFTAIVFFFQAQLDYFAGALHEGVQVLRLGVAASQARDCRDVIALFVAFDDDRKLAGTLHRPILARRESFASFGRPLLGAQPGGGCPHVIFATRLASQRTNRLTRSRDGSSGCGTSRSGRADCRRAGRSPSSRWESSAHPENRSRLESTRRNG
jgi:hypothetical protein